MERKRNVDGRRIVDVSGRGLLSILSNSMKQTQTDRWAGILATAAQQREQKPMAIINTDLPLNGAGVLPCHLRGILK